MKKKYIAPELKHIQFLAESLMETISLPFAQQEEEEKEVENPDDIWSNKFSIWEK